jgi:hypothetical protein
LLIRPPQELQVTVSSPLHTISGPVQSLSWLGAIWIGDKDLRCLDLRCLLFIAEVPSADAISPDVKLPNYAYRLWRKLSVQNI